MKQHCCPVTCVYGRFAAEADDVINVGADEIVDLMTTVEVCMDGVFAAVRLYRPILNIDRAVKLGHTLLARVIVAVDVVVPHKYLLIAY